ncbi:glutathione S-transferase family protein [Thorsellia kenyensis]|uniref:Glutathione S-transferase family protein n=1 Tax=Thorsellia kenyensis TaxID=1549888 RepID=A0ABV6C705_9GAMM
MMQLIVSALSPFARKCVITAHHVGIIEKISLESSLAHPIDRNQSIVEKNPLGQIPTLTLDNGQVLHDSRVICEYFNHLGQAKLFGDDSHPSFKWEILTDASLADGITDATILVRYEQAVRPQQYQWNEWVTGQLEKVHKGLSAFDSKANSLMKRFDIGTISLICALDYLSIRLPELDWVSKYPNLANWYNKHNDEHVSIAKTKPNAP